MANRNQTEGVELIFSSLRKIEGLILPDNITSFHNLDADTLVAIVVKALQCITGSESQFPGALPPNIAQRHRICTGIATKIKEIGYRGDCGYNQLLYPAEGQTISLLAWLVLQLPRGEEVRNMEHLGTAALLNSKISGKLREWKEQPWFNPNCTYGAPPRNVYDINPHRTLDLSVAGHSVFDIYRDCSERGISAESSILERHSLELIQDSKSSSRLQSDFDIDDNSNNSNVTAISTSGSRSFLSQSFKKANHDRLFSGSSSSSSSCEGDVNGMKGMTPVPSSFDRAACIKAAMLALDLEDHDAGVLRRAAEEQSMKIEIEAFGKKIELDMLQFQSLKDRSQEGSSSLNALESDFHALSAESEELERDVLIKRRTLELIPFAAENIVKLTDQCEAASERLHELNREWDREGGPLEKELHMRREEKMKRHKKCQDQLEDIKTMKNEMAVMVSDLKEKEGKALSLAREMEDLPDNLTRASYTHRILDIVTSLEKQTKETDKIISDIRSIQKQLNTTRSALNRADTIAEELIFSAAHSDQNDSVKVETYRRLGKFRATFNDSVETVGKIGQLDTAARELEAKIQEEKKRISIDNFSQIRFDLNEIQNENNQLILMIKSGDES